MNSSRRSRLISFCIMFSYLFPYGYSLQAENEIGFLETFALAPKRAEALAELIPGTEDHYYYSALLPSRKGVSTRYPVCWNLGKNASENRNGGRKFPAARRS